MKWFWLTLVFMLLILVFAVLSLLYQPEIVNCLSSKGLDRLAGVFSGPWWHSIPTLILAVGIVVAIRQIIEAKRSTNAQVAVGLSQKLRDKEVLEILQKVYELESESIASLPDSTEKKDEQLENEITQVLDNLELLGALVAQGIIDEGMAIVVYGGPTALKCWYKLNRYITILRSTRHSLCGRYLEDFAARTWERSHHEGQKIYFYRVKGEPLIDLIKYFEEQPELRPERYKKQINLRVLRGSLKGLRPFKKTTPPSLL